jgi:hypothetical protein
MGGIPDNQQVGVEIGKTLDHRVLMTPGTAAFRGELDAFFENCQAVYCSATRPTEKEMDLGRLPIINHMADADLYREALKMAEKVIRHNNLPCFNHPSAVAASSRDQVSRRLQGVPGLLAPKTLRFKPTDPRHFPAAMERGGLQYPVLVRLVGTQSGQTLLRIDSMGDWMKVYSIPWGGAEVYLTQFHDFQDADGLYRKLRFAVVGGEVFVRHRMAGSGWMMHSRSRIESRLDEESAFLNAFDTVTRPRLEPVVRAMAERMRLDYFGVDGSLRPDGTFLLFEANASMSLLRDTFPKPNIFEAHILKIAKALMQLLVQPNRWACMSGAQTSAAGAS